MCLIAISGKGTDKYSNLFLDSLITSAKTNDDGIGLAFRKAKQQTDRPVIYFSKGLFKIEDVIELLKREELLPEDELVVHLRKISSGVRSTENCHPFICSFNDDWINDRGPSHTVNAAVFHNGHFADFKDSANRKSDTHLFVERFLKKDPIMNMLRADQEAFIDTFSPILKTNKLAILDPKSPKVIMIGEFLEDEGYFFSNASYKDKSIINRGGININTNSRIRRQESFDFSGFNKMEQHLQDPTNKLLITDVNYDKLVIIATEADLELGISINDRLIVNSFTLKSTYQSISKMNKPNHPIWIRTEDLYTKFDAFKKMSAVDIFSDFYMMKSWLRPVTNTVMRKLTKTIEKNRYKPDDYQVEVSFKNKDRYFRIGAVKMFIKDYESDYSPSPIIILPENINKKEPNPFITNPIEHSVISRLLSEDEIAWRKEQEELGFTPEDKDFLDRVIKKELEKKETSKKNLNEKEVAEDILKKDKLADEFFENHSG